MDRSYARGSTTVERLTQTIGDSFEQTVSRFGDREALVSPHQEQRFTYAELNDAVDRLAAAFLRLGLEPGERVGIWALNCFEWVITQFATAKAGLILVTINPAYRASECEYVLNQSGCRMLISARSFKTSNYVAMVESVRTRLPNLEHVVFLDSPEWDALMVDDQDGRRRLAERMALLEPDDAINIQYTSGTTGFPKGATLTHDNILNNGYFVGEGCGYSERDRVCIPVPLYHCFGMVMGVLACVTHGATMVLPSATFEPQAVLQAVQDERCTSLYGVPTMFIAELAQPDFGRYDLTSLRTGIMAGAPCPIEVMKRVIADMHVDEVTIAYGMTETSPVSTQTALDDPVELRVSTVGTVHPHVEVKIVDPVSGRCVPRGATGELLTRGYSVMLGYWDDPGRTAEVIDQARWMHSGDLATMDADGYIRIVGRSKDMVIRGGENVYPREIEEFLHTHPDVVETAVVGVPDVRFGEELMAWIRTRDGASLSEDAVRDFCRGRIAHYKVPRYVKLVDEFPMTSSGKVQKFKLREMAITELELEPESPPHVDRDVALSSSQALDGGH